ncbi:hypothetical protein [Mediterraneibacter glycyrrhizinilyticus]|uniref:hypothetical protein n=1 Tax=Mediterraneibacter glycyrrhizinilyticus TaxID=342942 RepID=UPI000B07BD5E
MASEATEKKRERNRGALPGRREEEAKRRAKRPRRSGSGIEVRCPDGGKLPRAFENR